MALAKDQKGQKQTAKGELNNNVKNKNQQTPVKDDKAKQPNKK